MLHCTYIDRLICDKNDTTVCLHTHTHTHYHDLKLALKVLTEKLSNWDVHMGLQQLFTVYCLFVTKHL